MHLDTNRVPMPHKRQYRLEYIDSELHKTFHIFSSLFTILSRLTRWMATQCRTRQPTMEVPLQSAVQLQKTIQHHCNIFQHHSTQKRADFAYSGDDAKVFSKAWPVYLAASLCVAMSLYVCRFTDSEVIKLVVRCVAPTLLTQFPIAGGSSKATKLHSGLWHRPA
jgi:mannose/fructose/N-acetylgalactosamine-specific phosphotransferase system component IIC